MGRLALKVQSCTTMKLQLKLGLALCMMVWLVGGHESEGSSSVTSPEFLEPIPLMRCDTDKECKKECQKMKDKTACSSLKFCTDPPIVYEKKQRVKRMQDPDAYDDSGDPDAYDDSDHESEETKNGVCNDKKDCKKDTDCPGFQRNLPQEDGSLIIKATGSVCANGKCAWSGMFSSSIIRPNPNHPESGQPHLEPAVMGES